jgi:hypothetical protein
MQTSSLMSLWKRLGAVLFVLLLSTAVDAQITPSDDSYVDTATPAVNYGTKTTLGVVSASQTIYITFDLSSIPSGYTGSSIAKASLKLYVNTVTTAGSLNVDYVNGAWTEKTITASNAPPPGTTIAASVPLAKAQAHDYVLIDVTAAVAAWLNGTQTNDGIALVANSPLSATFDSKESTTNSHPAELDIVFAGGGGAITGVLTGSSSGLTGGGMSGTLNLSLLTSCSSKQVLAWTGSAWACSNAGTGTITGVTPGRDMTGGGTSGNVTLGLDVTKVPELAAANTFTGNQTVNGNVSATGLVTGSAYNIGSNLFAFGSFANGNAFFGFAGNTTGTGSGNTGSGWQALSSDTTGGSNTANGSNSLQFNTTGSVNTAIGWAALWHNTVGYENTALGSYSLPSNTTGFHNTAVGGETLVLNTTGNENTATGWYSLYSNTGGYNNTGIGGEALYSNQTGWANTATGQQALLANSEGALNTANGTGALKSNSTGGSNTGIGANALYSSTTGNANVAVGQGALSSSTTGGGNTASGFSALGYNTTGNNNTAVGYSAGTDLNTPNLTNATTIGAFADVTASNSLVLGSINGVNGATADTNVGIGTTAPTARLHIGNSGTSNPTGLRIEGPSKSGTGALAASLGGYGDFNIDAVGIIGGRFSVKENGAITIGNTAASHILSIQQGYGAAYADGWVSYSSRRWKTNIQPLHGALAKVEQLRGVSYELKDSGRHQIGVIAEEVGAVVPEVVTWENNGKDAQGVDYARLTALLIEATKEQQALIHHQQEQIQAQQAQMKHQEARIGRLARQVRAVQTALKSSSRAGSEVRNVNASSSPTYQ